MSILVQSAPRELREGDWDARREELGDLVLRTLETVAPGITARVVARQVLTPARPRARPRHDRRPSAPRRARASTSGSRGGRCSAWRAIGCRSAGGYLCGSGRHPGGGVTGLPGRNAAREILADVRRGRRVEAPAG